MIRLVLPMLASILLFGCYDSRQRVDGGRPPPPPQDGGGCGLSECGGLCVDVLTDEAHCGVCDRPCEVGESCVGGECVAGCVPDCSGAECGDDGCGGSCGTCTTGTCSAGTCVGASTGESCLNPTIVSGTGGIYTADFSGRVADHTPFTCGNTSGQPDVAFQFTAIVSGTVVFETSGSIDTVMAIYGTSSCTSSLSCDDDGSASGSNSYVSMTVIAGATYYIVIAPYSGTTTGTTTLTVTVLPPS